MKEIAATDFYRICVDKSKNRIYMWFMGNLTKRDQMPTWLNDLKTAQKTLSDQFTMMDDLTGVQSILIYDLFEEGMKMLLQEGIKKTADVFGDQPFQEAGTDMSAKKTGFQKRNFKTREEADAWLDE